MRRGTDRLGAQRSYERDFKLLEGSRSALLFPEMGGRSGTTEMELAAVASQVTLKPTLPRTTEARSTGVPVSPPARLEVSEWAVQGGGWGDVPRPGSVWVKNVTQQTVWSLPFAGHLHSAIGMKW